MVVSLRPSSHTRSTSCSAALRAARSSRCRRSCSKRWRKAFLSDSLLMMGRRGFGMILTLRAVIACALALAIGVPALAAQAAPAAPAPAVAGSDDVILQMNAAYRRGDRAQLTAL